MNRTQDVYFDILKGNNSCLWERQDDLGILYVAAGEVQVICSFGEYFLEEEDVITVNAYEIYMLQISCGGMVLRMHIRLNMLRTRQDMLCGRSVFCCLRKTDEDNQIYIDLCGHIAKAFQAVSGRSSEGYEAYRQAFWVIEIMHKYFTCAIDGVQSEDTEAARMKRIVEYIEKNYAETISLEEIASAENLSAGFFSRYFKRQFGMTFTIFLRKVRLAHAYTHVLWGKESISVIALNHGFANSNAFILAFRETYGCTPGEYRKLHADEGRTKACSQGGCDEENIKKKLEKYIFGKLEEEQMIQRPSILKRHYVIRGKSSREIFKDSWRELLGGGHARNLLIPVLQKQIQKCQKELHFRYIYIRDIFDDDMGAYQERVDGKWIYDFAYIDMLFDFVLLHSLKPYLELGDVIVLSCEKYIRKVEQFISHCKARYGVEEVSSWKYSVEGLDQVTDGAANWESFIEGYLKIWLLLKNRLPKTQIGGPGGNLAVYKNSVVLWEDFLLYCKSNSCLPDFINVSCFYTDLSDKDDFLHSRICRLEKLCHKNGIKKLPIILEAWNTDLPFGDYDNDGAVKSAFMVRNMIQNGQYLQGMCFYPLSDYGENNILGQAMFCGGRGALSYDGLPKSTFHVWGFLEQISGEIVDRGQEYILVKKGREMFLLACYYSGSTETAREKSPEKEETEIELRFSIELESGKYELEQYSVGTECGSAYDAWLYLGKPEKAARKSRVMKTIERIADPLYTPSYVDVQDSTLEYVMQLKANDAAFLMIHPLEHV